MSQITFRVTGRNAAPLAELFQIVDRIISGQTKRGIEHGRHVPRVEEEPIPERIRRIVWVVMQELREEHIDEIRTAHGSARMA